MGLIAVAVGAGAFFGPQVLESWDSFVFDHQVRGEPATFSAYAHEKRQELAASIKQWWTGAAPPTPPETPEIAKAPDVVAPPPLPQAAPPAPIPENTLIGRLTIPRLRLKAIVREGSGENTLSLALGHIPGTSLPGQSGTVGIAGHRDTIFRSLRNIKKNDVIRFETLKGSRTYQVVDTKIVKPSDVSVLKPQDHPELTLVTCYPFYYVGSAPDRFIVQAREISNDPDSVISEIPETAPKAPPTPREGSFTVALNHSGELAPGISMGVTDTDAERKRVSGWMWIMPDRKTVWLRDQAATEPLVFYRDGKKRELVITGVSSNGVSGYVD